VLLSDVVTFLSSVVVLTPNGEILVGATIDSVSEMGIVHSSATQTSRRRKEGTAGVLQIIVDRAVWCRGPALDLYLGDVEQNCQLS
jgi:hypothetical protein